MTKYSDAIKFLNSTLARDQAEMLESASGFIVECHDPETGSRTFTGPFDTAPEAFQYAEHYEAGINRGLGPSEPPYVLTVYPIQPVEES